MITKISLCCLVFCAFLGHCNAQSENQSCDCKPLLSCPAGVRLFNKKEAAADEQLRKAFCGYGDDSFPRVCCGDLAVDNHPNLRLLPEACGKVDGERIVGGTLAGLYEFPWMALISYNTRLGHQFQCGGTVLSDRYILTAAHCVSNRDIAGIRIGEHDYSTKRDCQGEVPYRKCEEYLQDKRVEKLIIHEKYTTQPTVLNDIALIRLARPIDLSKKNADPICLPITKELRNLEVRGSNGTVAGWGLTKPQVLGTTALLKVVVSIHSDESCKQSYNRYNKPGSQDKTENQLCAGDYNKDSCGGDSGGPLMVKALYKGVHKYVQYGVVSHGPKDCGSGFPALYTDVTKYMQWILDNIEE